MELIQTFGGDFGYMVRYRHTHPKDAHVDILAVEINGLSIPGNEPLFERADGNSSADTVTDMDQASYVVQGAVKWDGCANLDFGTADVMAHFCGHEDIDKFGRLLREIHRRCGQIMREAGVNVLDGVFE